jgi:hypothetical protein
MPTKSVAKAQFVEPMKAILVAELPVGPEWIFGVYLPENHPKLGDRCAVDLRNFTAANVLRPHLHFLLITRSMAKGRALGAHKFATS